MTTEGRPSMGSQGDLVLPTLAFDRGTLVVSGVNRPLSGLCMIGLG